MESHKKYCDLQYIVEGTEKIYWASLRKLTVEDDRTPEADIIFYKSGPEQGYTLLEAGMFGFYAPEDGHMPCIAVTEALVYIEQCIQQGFQTALTLINASVSQLIIWWQMLWVKIAL